MKVMHGGQHANPNFLSKEIVEYHMADKTRAAQFITHILKQSNSSASISSDAITDSDLDTLREAALQIVDDFHRENPNAVVSAATIREFPISATAGSLTARSRHSAFKLENIPRDLLQALGKLLARFFYALNFGVQETSTARMNGGNYFPEAIKNELGEGSWSVLKVPGDGDCMLTSAALQEWLQGNGVPDSRGREIRDFKFGNFADIELENSRLRAFFAQEMATPQGDRGSGVFPCVIDSKRRSDLALPGVNVTIREMVVVAKALGRDIAFVEEKGGSKVLWICRENGTYSNSRLGSAVGNVADGSITDEDFEVIVMETTANPPSGNDEWSRGKEFADLVKANGGAILCSGNHARFARYTANSQ